MQASDTTEFGLNGGLETAVQGSAAAHEPDDVAGRLRIRLFHGSALETGAAHVVRTVRSSVMGCIIIAVAAFFRGSSTADWATRASACRAAAGWSQAAAQTMLSIAFFWQCLLRRVGTWHEHVRRLRSRKRRSGVRWLQGA